MVQQSDAPLTASEFAAGQQIFGAVNQTTFLLTHVRREPLPQLHTQHTVPADVWITPAGELLRISAQGRILRTTGSAYADWHDARTTAIPRWRDIQRRLDTQQVVQYQRIRDTQPGQHFGIPETVTIRQAAAPASFLGIQNPSSQLHWFEESSQWQGSTERLRALQSTLPSNTPLSQPLPPAIFGVAFHADGTETMVYSKQCLSAMVCIQLLHQPPQWIAQLSH